jgi:glutamyl-tRNA reductase
MKESSLIILMLGLNHKVAPVEVRERLAFGAEHAPSALREMMRSGGGSIREIVLLSTCNRTEVYVHASNTDEAETVVRNFLAGRAALPTQELGRMLYVARGEETARHLMRVSAGLDSLVLGENEILGQVRAASEMAQSAGTNGPLLSALFRYAVQAGKRARHETGIGRGDISVASVVVELAEQVLGPLGERTALLIGAGKISTITARALLRSGLHCIMVANRTFERAQKLAENLRGVAVHFDALDETLKKADIVICSTGAPHLVLHPETIRRAQAARGSRPLLVADLAVPRDADPDIASIPGVRLANIDDLDEVVKTRHPLTASVCCEVEDIVREELEGFRRWHDARRCAPVIQALHQKAETICQSEVDHTLRRMGSLTPRQQHMVLAMGRAIVAKLLHEPITHLRELPLEEETSTYLEVVQDLYDLQ